MTTTDPAFQTDRATLVRRLKAMLPAHCLLVDEEDLRPYECDGLTAFRELPLAVCLPETEAQAVAVLRTCHQLGVPVVARGAGTGLSGGAMPHAQGVVLSLARFNRILRIDPEARLAVVQPGVRNLAVSEAAAPHGLYYAPDPSSQIACTIGGNVAENSGGVHCLKYGLTVHNVLRIRVVTIAGETLEIGSEAPDSPGYDLLALLIGSEGMLGVITEVTVKLVPKPELAQVVMASFDDVGQAADAVAAVIAAGIIPAGLEMMDKAVTAAVEPFVQAGYDLSAEAILLCESDGTPEEVAEEIARINVVLTAAGARGLRVSQSEVERLRFWAGRKAAFSGHRPHLARLLLHGRHHPAQAPGRGPVSYRRLGHPLWSALRQRLPCRGRESSSTDHVRRRHPGRLGPGRGLRGRDPRTLGQGRRHHHGRARGRHREDQSDVCPVRDTRVGDLSPHQGRLRRDRPAQPRQGGAQSAPLRRIRAHARPSWRTEIS
jgi:glycolate oxidase subunit GlcD